MLPAGIEHADWIEAAGRPALQLLVAAVCGGILGWDRERRSRAAGMRTHMMVALGAATFALLAREFIEAMESGELESSIDAGKIIAAIVGGVGFLGAGAIIQAGGRVRGLTTAAGLWVAASIGVCAGTGFFIIAGLTTGMGILILTVLRPFEKSVAGSEEQTDDDGEDPTKRAHETGRGGGE